MAPSSAAPSPLQALSPSLQNIPSARSPFGKPLPLRKPSLKDAISVKSPQKLKVDGPVSIAEDSPQPKKRRKVEPDYDMAEHFNRATAAKYVKGEKIGEGTFANVYKAHLAADPSSLVAIKKFKIQEEQHRMYGIGFDTINEIKYLQELSHPNVIKLFDVFATKDQNINAVIEFLGRGNLEDMMHKNGGLSYSLADIKAWMGMIFRGIYFCHQNFVLHRDLKPGNLLIAADGEVKIADFGFARSYAPPGQNMTQEVVTLWYRSPELLFGARHYSGHVDIWSIGCIMAELIRRKPFMFNPETSQDDLANNTRESQIGQLEAINVSLGTPTEDNWPGVSKLKDYIEFEHVYPLKTKRDLKAMFPTLDDVGVELMLWTVTMDPRQRPTARQCLEHEWWVSEPRPTDKENLPHKKDENPKNVASALAQKPGVIDERLKGVARKLDFGR